MLARRSHIPAALVALPILLACVLSLSVAAVSAQPPLEPPLGIVDAAIADLGQRLARPLARGLNVQFEYTWQQFPDAALGCPQPGQVVAQVLTPGYIIHITARSEVYDYRASEDGLTLFLCGRLDAQGTPQPLDVTPGVTPTGAPAGPTATPIVIAPLGSETPTPTAPVSLPTPVLEPVTYDTALAYVGQDGNVYITALGEGPGTPLTGDANRRATQEFPFFAEDRDYGLLRWSPDGARLLFVDHKDGTLYLAVSGQAPVAVARGLEEGLPPAWSPDGAEFVIGVPTDVTLDAGAHMVQLQAFPADGGAPRYAGEFALKGCSSQIDDPTWALYQDETGPAGGNDVFQWTAAGYVHSLGCGGQGLGLTGFDNLTLWEAADVVRPAVSPDRTRAAAIRPAVEGAPASLVIVDLLTGQTATLGIQDTEPQQVAWSADGTRILFSVAAAAATVSGNADSAVGATLFPIWPLKAHSQSLALWRVPAGGGQAQLLTPDLQGYAIGHIAAAPGDGIVLFSVVGSSAPIIEQINNGADAATASAAAPQVTIWFVELPGGFNQLQVGGQPVFGAAFSALPAFALAGGQSEVQAVVCEGALPSRLAVDAGARVLPAAAVNMREFANSQASRVDVIPAGARISVVGGPVCDSGILWWQVEYRGRRGWAAESLNNSYLLSPEG